MNDLHVNDDRWKTIKSSQRCGTCGALDGQWRRFKVQTHRRKSCPRPSPARTAGWSRSTVCPPFSAGRRRPGKWRCTSLVPRCSLPPAPSSDTLTSPRSAETSHRRWSPSDARPCGWEAWGFFPARLCPLRRRTLGKKPGCKQSTGRSWEWRWSCCRAGSRPERTPGLDRSSTPAALFRSLHHRSCLRTQREGTLKVFPDAKDDKRLLPLGVFFFVLTSNFGLFVLNHH